MSSTAWELPADLLGHCLATLSLRQKLTCEAVCKTWLQVLRGPHAGGTQHSSTVIWGHTLRLFVHKPWNPGLRKISLVESTIVENQLPEIIVASNMLPTPSRTQFLRWLERMCCVVSKIRVDSAATAADEVDWLLPHLIETLDHSRHAGLPECKLHLSTGAGLFLWQSISLNSLGHLLTDWTVQAVFNAAQLQTWQGTSHLTSLTRLDISYTSGGYVRSSQDMKELQFLTRLHTLGLERYSNLDLWMGNLTNLQRLELTNGKDFVCNLERLTQLTALCIRESRSPFLKKLTLPGSNEARLQHLEVLRLTCLPDPLDIYNLELALQLTSLHLDEALPDNLKDSGWPKAMPCLAHLNLCNSPLPAEMLMYTSLRQLSVSEAEWVTVPEWVSDLTQLQRLVMHHCWFDQFPEAVLGLSQLQVLDMQYIHARPLPGRLIECATWPNLTELNLTLQKDQQWDLTSQKVLLSLVDAFRVAGVRSPLVTDDCIDDLQL